MGVVAGLAELAVEVVLDEIVVSYFVAVLGDEGVYPGVVKHSHLSPALVVGGLMDVAEHTPGGVGAEPVVVVGDKLLELIAVGGAAAALGIHLAEVLLLGVVDALVVNL